MRDAKMDTFKVQILNVFSEKSPELHPDNNAASSLRPFTAIKDIVISMRDQGCGQEDVYACLDSLRNDVPSEAEEDVLLEVMDFVVGFCSPKDAIFPNEVSDA